MKKLKKSLYLLGSMFILALTLVVIGEKINVNADAPTAANVSYRIYDYNSNYTDFLDRESTFYDDASTVLSENFGPTNTKGAVTEYKNVTTSTHGSEIADAKSSWANDAQYGPDADQTGIDYYGADIFDLLGANLTDGSFSFRINCIKKGVFEAEAIVYTFPGKVKTDFKPEEDIVIEPWVKISGATQVGASIIFDHTGFASSYTIIASSDIIAPAYGDTPVTKLTGGYPNVGWSFDPDSSDGFYAGTNVRAGAVHVKLDSGLSGSYPVSYSTVATANKSAIQVFANSSADTYTLTGSSIFVEAPGSIEIEASGDATNLKSATINGTTIDASSTPTIADATDGTTSTGISAPSSIKIAATVAGGGTVTGVKFGTSSTDVSNTALDHTSTTGTWDCNISNDTTFVPGSDVYVTVYTKSGDGTKNGSYVLIVEKAKLSTAALEGVTITYTPSGETTPVTATLDKTFASGTTSYTSIVPTNSTVKVTPTYDVTNNYYQTCLVNGATTSTASGDEVTIGTSATSFTIIMKAQDGTPKTYTFTLTRTSDDTSLTKMEYAATGGSKTTIALTGTDTYTVSTGIDYTKTGFTIYPTLKTGQTAKIWEVETPTNKVAITSTGKAYTFTPDPTDGFASVTKVLKLEVTSAFGTPKEYTINITRDKADEDTSLNTIIIQYTEAGTSKTKTAVLQGDGTYLVTGVAYGVTNYTIKTTLTKTAIQKWSIDGGANVLSSGATSASCNFSTAKTQVNDIQTVTVIAQNTNKTKDYTLKVERAGANNDTSLSSIVVNYKLANATTGNVTAAASDGINYSADAIPFLAQSYTITFTLSATNAALQKWAIVAAGGTLPTTPNSSCKASGASTATYSFTAPATDLYGALSDEYVVRVFAQDDTYADYNLKVNRVEADTDTSLSGISIKYGATVVNATFDGTDYVVDNVPFKTNAFKVSAALSQSIQKYSIDGGTTKINYGADSANVSFTPAGSDNGDATTENVTITVYAQDQTKTKTYNLKVNRKEADRNLELTSLTITNNSGTPVGTFNPMNQTFAITVSGKLASSVSSLTASATLPTDSLSKVYIGTKNADSTDRTASAARLSLVQPFATATTADDTFEFNIYVENELGNTSTPIVASFTRAKTDDTNTITVTAEADIAQEATSVTTLPVQADPSVNSFKVDSDYETSYINFTIKCTDSSATDTYIYINGATAPLASPYVYKYIFTATKNAIVSQPITVDVYTAAKPYSATPRIPSATYTIYVNRAQADDDDSFKTLEVTDISGTVLTKGSDSSSSKYNYKGIDVTTGAFSSGKFKINAAATSTKSKIYWSDTASNLKQNAYASSDEFDVGLFPTGKTIYVSCEAQYGNLTTVEIYTCSNDSRDPDNKVSDVEIAEKSDFTFVATQTEYTFDVPFSVEQVNLKIKKNSLKSTLAYKENGVQIGGSKQGLNDQYVEITTSKITSGSTLICKFVVTAENESAGTEYTIKITRLAGQTGAKLETLTINGIDVYGGTNANVLENYTSTSTNIDFVMAPTSTSANISFTVSTKATYTLTNVTTATATTDNPYSFAVASGSYTELEFKIQSEKNSIDSPTTFTTVIVKVYSASTDATLKAMDLYKADGVTLATDTSDNIFNFDDTVLDQGTFTAPFKIGDAVVLDVEANDANAVITGAGNKSLAAGGTIKYKVLVTSQYAALNTSLNSTLKKDLTKEYILTIKRNNSSNVATLDELVVKDGSGNTLTLNPAFVGSTLVYKIENLADSITMVNVSCKPTDPNATVTGQTGDQTLTLPAGSTTAVEQELTILVTAEDGVSKNKYSIKLSRTQVVLDSVNDIDNIVVTDSQPNTYATYSSATHLYEFDIPATEGGVTFNVTTKSNSSTLVNATGDNLTNPFVVTLNEGETKEITIICKAENGDPGSPYVYKITRKVKDTDATLKSLSYNGIAIADFSSEKSSYTIYLTHEVETFYLEYVINKATSKLSSNDAPKDSPINLVDGINGPYQLIIVAENTLITKSYTVTVIRDASSDLQALEATDLSNNELVDNSGNKLLQFESTTLTYSFQVPYENGKIKLNATAVGGNLVKITGAGEITLNEGLNELKVEVTPASGLNKKVYNINITRVAGETDNTIKSFRYFKSLEDKNHLDDSFDPAPIYTDLVVNATDTEYSYYVSRDITVFEPVITLNSNKATMELPTDKVISVGAKNVFEVIVKNQKGQQRKYKFIVYNADVDNDISGIKLKDSAAGSELVDADSTKLLEFNKEQYTYNITVPYSQKDIYLETLLKSSYATMKYSTNGLTYSDYSSQKLELNQGANTFYFYAISEYGKLVNDGTTGVTKKYAITITRAAANGDPTLKSLTVTISGTLNSWDATKDDDQALGTSNAYSYVIENIGDAVTSISISAIPNQATTIIGGQIGNQSLNDSAASAAGYIFNFTVTATAEDGSVNTYTITVSRGALDTDSDNTLTGITVRDSLGNSTYLTFNAAKTVYDVVIPYSISGVKVTSYTINATKGATSPATINGAGQFSIDTTSGDYTKVHNVYATSQKGEDGTKYTINVTVAAANGECRLDKIYIGGEEYLDFNPNVFNYVYGTVPNSMTKIDIAAIAKDPSAVISGDIGTDLPLSDSKPNLFTIAVTAENGDYRQYKISITRDAPTPVLINLGATAIDLLDTNDKSTTFSSDVTTYHSIVANSIQSATITASVENANYDVTCSNSIPGTTTGVNRSFTVVLNVGENTFNIKVTNYGGKSKTYTYIINRRDEESSNTSITSLVLVGHEDSKEYLGSQDFSDLKNTYTVTVPNRVKNVDLNIQVEDIADAFGPGATVRYINEKNLRAGEDNEVIALITAENGTTRTISVMVHREAYDFSVAIAEIARFVNDYAQANLLEKYSVTSDVSALTFNITNQDPTNTEIPNYVILKGNTLKPGLNDVLVKIICDDGTTKDIEFKVERAPYEFEVGIKEISRFKNDYAADDIQRRYNVESDINSLTFEIKDKNANASYTPTYKILSGELLKVGSNNVSVQIVGEDGYKSDPIELVVVRDAYEFEVGIKEISRFKNDYADDNIQRKYVVASDVSKLTFDIKDKNINSDAPTFKFISGEKLEVGTNNVEIEILGADGYTVTVVELVVVREEYEFNIAAPEIKELENDYSTGNLKTKYTVPNKVTKINFDITNADADVETQPTYIVLSGDTLKPGDNQVKVQITAADGTITTETINVYRQPMEFRVLENNEVDKDYTCKPKANSNDVYVIDLGKDGKASQIKNYEKYISWDESTNNLEVTKLTDTSRDDCNEVMLQIKTADGSESKIVKIELQATKSPATSFDLYVWIVLGLAIILLIIILICVNRDKYGSVSRKRKAN